MPFLVWLTTAFPSSLFGCLPSEETYPFDSQLRSRAGSRLQAKLSRKLQDLPSSAEGSTSKTLYRPLSSDSISPYLASSMQVRRIVSI